MNDPHADQTRLKPPISSIRPQPVIPAGAQKKESEDFLDLEPMPERDPLEPVSLVEESSDGPSPVSKIRAFGVATGAKQKSDWKRKTQANGTGAVRVRSFHGKFSEQGMDFLDSQINEWLDGHPEIEIKFVTSTVGTFEGKIREPALVLNLWY